MPEQLSALVTGGSSGIGHAIARVLAAEGYAVTICGRDAARLEHAATTLAAQGAAVRGLRCDVRNESEIRALVEEHARHHHDVDVLVNNAGVSATGGIENVATDVLDEALAANLRSVHLVTRECVPLLREAAKQRQKAVIVNLSSIVGKAAVAREAAYSATKAAVISLTQSMHTELAPHGIHATAFCPSYVHTPMSADAEVPADEMIQLEDVGHAVRFLLRTSSACFVPEIVFARASERFSSW